MGRYLRTANFITCNAGRPFAWGDWDCNLFLIDLLDALYPLAEPRAQQVRGKYNTRLGAARFQRGFTPAPEFFRQQGLELLQVDSDQFQEHDIIFENERRFWHMSLFFAQQTWAVTENHTLLTNVIEPGRYLIARNNE